VPAHKQVLRLYNGRGFMVRVNIGINDF